MDTKLVRQINRIKKKFGDSFKGLPKINPKQYINLNDFYMDLKTKLLFFDQHSGIICEDEDKMLFRGIQLQ